MAAFLVWSAGAAYCHGYERLLSGAGEWASSFIWSALAVMPWFALFEWSKSASGRRIGSDPALLAVALIATATVSIALEVSWHSVRGYEASPLGLMIMRRLPAIGASLILILWAGAVFRREIENFAESVGAGGRIADLADAIHWVSAADNYVELHMRDRTVLRRMTMREAERQLAGAGFVRVHRRFLINRGKLEAIVGSNGDRRVRLAGGTELPVGPRFAANLRSSA